ncbi:hypothetical protein MIND_00142700 [Mycena indigotica]|uniref:Uncharacterized protein n=1 Tax=Mycena indigotica TaxID=2126181 RepID=A0A8H6TGG6_9AGAR|nr:uncharacterized protein MIND_00142700 [Mycena indigotica]KAF7316241.1 hypothetical protein MIND_00142700 [Mycena indigotica]
MSATGRSPLSVVFLLHIALEVPLAIQGVFSPTSLPFVQLNNTTLVILKLYSALVLGLCLVTFLCYSLPEFLPGKRALAIGLCVYHTACSTILYNAPRFIPASFGGIFEAYRVTPEIVWGTLHGLVGLSMVIWWQGTVHYAQLMRGAAPQ